MAINVSLLKRSTITADYLNSNSSTHSFLFGALAELVDNSRDANASYLKICTEEGDFVQFEGKFALSFLDDGHGMTPSECADIMKLGVSNKKNANAIGKYGNGLKSAALRIANDFIVFTKNDGKLSIAFLSRTFYKAEHVNKTDVFVALPSFNENDQSPIYDSKIESRTAKARHDCEMYLIFKYSPFNTLDKIFEQFNRIENKAGTLVILFNLLMNNRGHPQITFDRINNDIVLAESFYETDTELDFVPPERSSFKEYLKILYSVPRMRIYLNGRKIKTRILDCSMLVPCKYKYLSKTASSKKLEDDINNAEIEYEKLNQRLREATSILGEAKQDMSFRKTRIDDTRILNEKNIRIVNLNNEIEKKKKQIEDLKKMKGMERQFVFTFGLNLQNRAQCGAFIYNQQRLISMYKKMGKQLKNDPEYYGIIVILDVPYSIMLPQHNKQGFADEVEYEKLKKAIGDYMDSYYYDALSHLHEEKLSSFWEMCGYSNDYDQPSNTRVHVLQRFLRIPLLLQCDTCLKWRQYPPSSHLVGFVPPDKWKCADSGYDCMQPEKLTEATWREKRNAPSPRNPQQNTTLAHRPLNPMDILKQREIQKTIEENRENESQPTTSRAFNRSTSIQQPTISKALDKATGSKIEGPRKKRRDEVEPDLEIRRKQAKEREVYKSKIFRKYFSIDPAEVNKIKSEKDIDKALVQHARNIRIMLMAVSPKIFDKASDDFILSFDYVKYILHRFKEVMDDTDILI